MQTKDIIVYGAIFYLFFMLKKKQTCKCNLTPILPIESFSNSKMVKNCLNCDFSNVGLSNVMSLPIFTNVNNQVEPTPATILDPLQLAVYNNASIKGNLNKYIC